MTSESKTKTLTIAVLLVAVLALGIGFAAFSNTLTISSSASVTPDADTFKVVFSSSGTSVVEGGVSASTNTTPNVAPDATIDNTTGDPTITGLKATFTAPGQEVQYKFYVANIGEYDAYLEKIDFENATGASIFKTCTAGTGTDATMVANACNGISAEVKIGGKTSDEAVGKMLSKGLYQEVVVTLKYESGSARADGPFSVAFGNIKLTYTSAKPSGSGSTPAVTYNIGDEVHLAGTTTIYKDYANSADSQPTCTTTETLDYTVWNVVNVSGDNITLYAGDFAAIGDSSFSRRTADSNASAACYDKFKIITASAVDVSDVTYGSYPISIPTISDFSNIITVSGSTYTLNNSGYTWFDRQTNGSGVALNDLGDSTNPYTYFPGGQLFFNQEGPGASVYRPIMTLTKTQLAGLVR